MVDQDRQQGFGCDAVHTHLDDGAVLEFQMHNAVGDKALCLRFRNPRQTIDMVCATRPRIVHHRNVDQ